ncbi:Ig-like domain-containing protein [Lyngbya sp. PCC 8106]|uniref:Ig-like domain-containing protein n=1 Tax=Lyngbya sp. (strain PCC 8106) TaxID=313612 RepID=UPI0035C8D0FF
MNINVLTNDSDPDGDSLNVSMVDGTNTKGQVSINNNGTISYDPNGQFDNLEADETATDSFSYTINDGQGGTDTATVNLTINGVSATTQPNDSSDSGDNTIGYNIIDDYDNSNTGKQINSLEGTNNGDVFVLGNGSTAFYNQSNWDDRAEISGFNALEDQIQLHGSPSDYQLIQRNGDTRIFLTEGTKEMIGIISGYSEPVSLTDDIFSYVSGTDSGTDTPEEPVNQAPTATNDTDSTDNAANNRIEGGNGNDELTGKGGGDTFVYQQPADGTDMITDFDASEGDRFEISASGFGGGLTVGTLASEQFVLGTVAMESDDRFLYDTASGNLFFDVDGIGSQTSTLLATLDGNPTLSANEFSIVA